MNKTIQHCGPVIRIPDNLVFLIGHNCTRAGQIVVNPHKFIATNSEMIN